MTLSLSSFSLFIDFWHSRQRLCHWGTMVAGRNILAETLLQILTGLFIGVVNYCASYWWVSARQDKLKCISNSNGVMSFLHLSILVKKINNLKYFWGVIFISYVNQCICFKTAKTLWLLLVSHCILQLTVMKMLWNGSVFCITGSFQGRGIH